MDEQTVVVLDTNILIAFPEVLSRRLTSGRLIVPLSVENEVRVLSMRQPGFKELLALYDAARREKIVTLHYVEHPQIEFPRSQTKMRSAQAASADLDVIATAIDLQKENKIVRLATQDRPLRQLAESSSVVVWGLEELKAFCLAGATVTKLDIQAEGVAAIQRRGIRLGFFGGIAFALLVLALWTNWPWIVAKLPIWGTLVLILVAAMAFYVIRGRLRLLYGIAEFLVGFLAMLKVFYPSFDHTKLPEWAFLQILSGIYVMIRGQDNIGKALQNTKFEYLWRKYSGDK